MDKELTSRRLSKKDFVEIEFTGKVKDGNIFDSNIKSDLDKAGLLNPKNLNQTKPFVFPLGEGMFLKSVDEFLIGKQTNKSYSIELTPEKAFGYRDRRLIKTIPFSVYKKQNIIPKQGMFFNFDGQLGKVLSVSSGRVITDFNNPLAGKVIEYKINVKRKITDIEEKVKSLMVFFFRQEFRFQINKKEKKLVLDFNEKQKELSPLIEAFKNKFKEILGLELEFKKENQPKQKITKTSHKSL